MSNPNVGVKVGSRHIDDDELVLTGGFPFSSGAVINGRARHIPNKFGGKATVADITHALYSLGCKLGFVHELRWSDRLTIHPWQSAAETVASLASGDSKLQQ